MIKQKMRREARLGNEGARGGANVHTSKGRAKRRGREQEREQERERELTGSVSIRCCIAPGLEVDKHQSGHRWGGGGGGGGKGVGRRK